MTRSWNIVMRRILEHCVDKGTVHCDDKCHGALCCQGSLGTVMTGGMEHCV